MKKLILIAFLAYGAMVIPASADDTSIIRHMKPHALGNMYTKALNLIEAEGKLDTLEPKASAKITDIHMDHGQVYVSVVKEGISSTVVYDPIANRVVHGDDITK